MKDHILATSFGQANIDNLPEGKKDYYRDYQPVSDSQKLLALADVARFINGWDAWLDGNLRLYQESPQNCPAEIDAWIVSEEGFLKSYVLSSLKSMEHLFKPDYFNDLKQRLSDILVGLSALKDPANPDRVLYQERLNTIRGEK